MLVAHPICKNWRYILCLKLGDGDRWCPSALQRFTMPRRTVCWLMIPVFTPLIHPAFCLSNSNSILHPTELDNIIPSPPLYEFEQATTLKYGFLMCNHFCKDMKTLWHCVHGKQSLPSKFFLQTAVIKDGSLTWPSHVFERENNITILKCWIPFITHWLFDLTLILMCLSADKKRRLKRGFLLLFISLS